MVDHYATDGEPEPTEFNVIVEGRADRPIRIPTVRVRRAEPLDPEVRRRLVEILRAVYERAITDDDCGQPLIVQIPPGSASGV